jgi:hypothetical protein
LKTCDHIASIPFSPTHIKRFSSKPAGFLESASILALDRAQRSSCALSLCPLAGQRGRESRRPGASNRASRFPRKTVRRIFAGQASLGLLPISTARLQSTVGDPGDGLLSAIQAAALGWRTFSILVPFPPWRRWQRRINALPTHGGRCRLRITAGALRQVAGLFRQVPSRKGCRTAVRPIIRPSFARAAGRAAAPVEWHGGWRPWSKQLTARSGGLAAIPSVPGRKDRRRGNGLLRRSEGRLRASGRLGHIGRENRLAGGLLRRPMPPGSEAGKRADAERAKRADSKRAQI